MAEKKKGGFHALEERIHAMEEEDQKRENRGSPQSEEAPRNASQNQENEQPRKK